MPWVEVFAVFGVCHLAGDFLLQTEWQATTKAGGLRERGPALRALALHTFTYTLAFVPALIWLAEGLSAAEVIGVGAIVALPHFLQDDGWLLDAYMRRVKHIEPDEHAGLSVAVDQSAHSLALFLAALVAGV